MSVQVEWGPGEMDGDILCPVGFVARLQEASQQAPGERPVLAGLGRGGEAETMLWRLANNKVYPVAELHQRTQAVVDDRAAVQLVRECREFAGLDGQEEELRALALSLAEAADKAIAAKNPLTILW